MSSVYTVFDRNSVNRTLTEQELLSLIGWENVPAGSGITLTKSTRSASGTVQWYDQTYQGIPVTGGSVLVRYDKSGSLRSLSATLASFDVNNLPVYNISQEDGIDIAKQNLNINKLRGEATAAKAVLPLDGKPAFCWQVDIPAEIPFADWEIFIDGYDGTALLIEDRLKYFNGAGLVFDPDPVTVTEDTTLRDMDDDAEAVPEEAYSEVELQDISLDDNEFYILSGPYVDTSPTESPARMEEPEFIFDRSDDRFEQVMAYFHLDRQARYIISLGFEELPPAPQPVNVNGVAEDLSFFSPQTGLITTGAGGVDDAEDADVLLHEYGHAILHEILGNWRGGETSLLAEGLCDYFAGDWSLETVPDFQPYRLFNWDRSDRFGTGRILNSDLLYDEAIQLEPHAAGELWSSLLTEIRQTSGMRDDWNRVVIDHLYSLNDSTTVRIAAEALLESDQYNAEGRFRHLIVTNCERREIFPRGQYSPEFYHLPLGDIERVDRGRIVKVSINSEFQLDQERLYLIYNLDEEPADTIRLRAVHNREGRFWGYLPAPGEEADLSYYFTAFDTSGVFSTSPVGAPIEKFRFHAGPDRIAPTITEVDSLPNSVFLEGEIMMSARVIDNIAVDEVSLIWYWGRMNPGGVTSLERSEWDSTLYTGFLNWSIAEAGIIHYGVTAVDSSAQRNSASSRIRSLTIVPEVTLDDFELSNRHWIITGWVRSTEESVTGEYSLHDRSPDRAYFLPREATVERAESWNFSGYDRARMSFWEKHNFNSLDGEIGMVEVRLEDEDEWRVLLNLSGIQSWWRLMTVDLSQFCGDDPTPIRIRFRSLTPEGAEPATGWKIDHVNLQAGNYVDTKPDAEQFPEEITLSLPYPNPANNSFSFSFNLHEAGKLKLIDIAGRAALTMDLPSGYHTSRLTSYGLPTGRYQIIISSQGRKQIRSIVILK